MTLFLCLCLGASALLLMMAFVMDMQALRGQISGANGLPMFAALSLSGIATLPVAGVTWWVLGFPSALGVIVASGLWHYVIGKLLFGALQRQSARMRQEQS